LALASAVANADGLSRLHGLWLADNSAVNDAGALGLAGSLRVTGRIRELFVQGLSISDDGLGAIIDSLSHLPELRHCVLGRASPEMMSRVELTQASMRSTYRREDLVIAAWPCPRLDGSLPKPKRKPKRKLGQRALPSRLRMRYDKQTEIAATIINRDHVVIGGVPI